MDQGVLLVGGGTDSRREETRPPHRAIVVDLLPSYYGNGALVIMAEESTATSRRVWKDAAVLPWTVDEGSTESPLPKDGEGAGGGKEQP